MKKSVLAIALVFASSAFALSASAACPDFAGRYLCKDNKGTHDLEVRQGYQNGQMVYVFASPTDRIEVVTDGTVRSFPNGNGMRDGRYAAVCKNNHVEAGIEAVLVDERNHPYGTVKVGMVFSRDDIRELITHSNGNAYVQGKVYPVDSTETCTLKR